MRFSCTIALLFAPVVATAGSAPSGFEAPAEVQMFESIRLIDGKGRVKGDSCADAVAAAVADVEAAAGQKKHPTIVALYDERPKDDLSATATEISCEVKGKKTVAKVEALAIRSGSDGAFPMVSPERVVEIADALVVEGAMVQLQLQYTDIVSLNGELYYETRSSRDEVFDKTVTKNSRIVELFRGEWSERMRGLAGTLAEVEELEGMHFSATVKYLNKKSEESTETWELFVPTAAAAAFGSAEMSEQELIEASVLTHAYSGKPAVKSDIDFVLADAR